MKSHDRLDPITRDWLVNRYRQSEYFSDLGMLSRVELGKGLFDLMNRFGETRLRRWLSQFCCELSWEDATTAMNFAIVCDREFLEASRRRNFL
jgi:hypothetical protein